METLTSSPPKRSIQTQLGPIAYGTWSGGRYMHFGETLSEEHYCDCIKLAYDKGIRTFVTADVYGQGQADSLLGRVLKGCEPTPHQIGTL